MKRALICAAFATACLAPQIAAAQAKALGLDRHQLEDADLIDAAGHEIGEVEGVVTDDRGVITSLIIELDERDPTPDKRVMLPLDGLRAAPERDGSGYDIQTRRSKADLMKLPPASTTSRGRPR